MVAVNQQTHQTGEGAEGVLQRDQREKAMSVQRSINLVWSKRFVIALRQYEAGCGGGWGKRKLGEGRIALDFGRWALILEHYN